MALDRNGSVAAAKRTRTPRACGDRDSRFAGLPTYREDRSIRIVESFTRRREDVASGLARLPHSAVGSAFGGAIAGTGAVAAGPGFAAAERLSRASWSFASEA